jgi:DICT domain-containing protein
LRRPIIAARHRGRSLSIGDLAARTGVPVGTLRTWEARYGVPAPTREGGGHRRYDDADVELVLETLRHRSAGLAMPAAVARARRHAGPTDSSLFAGLRRQHGDLAVQLLRKPTLLALCRAVEDECCAQADRPLLFASFQHERYYRASETRWRDLARTSRGAFVSADFDRPAPATEQPVQVAVRPDEPFTREWVLVCDAEDYPGCVVGWERPGQVGAGEQRRQFETFWSLDPSVVRDAARICAGLVERYRPEVPFPHWDELADTPPPLSPEARRAGRVLDRMLSYLSEDTTSR